jgi:hypothetical protein
MTQNTIIIFVIRWINIIDFSFISTSDSATRRMVALWFNQSHTPANNGLHTLGFLVWTNSDCIDNCLIYDSHTWPQFNSDFHHMTTMLSQCCRDCWIYGRVTQWHGLQQGRINMVFHVPMFPWTNSSSNGKVNAFTKQFTNLVWSNI